MKKAGWRPLQCLLGLAAAQILYLAAAVLTADAVGGEGDVEIAERLLSARSATEVGHYLPLRTYAYIAR